MRIDFAQKIIDKFRGKKNHLNPNPIFYGTKFIYSKDDATNLIIDCITNDKPVSICRYNSVEYDILKEFLTFKSDKKIKYTDFAKNAVKLNAGFFPTDDYHLTRFACELLELTRNVDLFAIWGNVFERKLCAEYLPDSAKIINLARLSAVTKANSWTKHLKGKKVLIIHPFKETIEEQYKKRELLHNYPEVLPEMELTVIKAPQTSGGWEARSGGGSNSYSTWFDALEDLKTQIRKADFEVALIGAGAYGMFLADYCKKLGKKGIHIGSSIQVLFGIKGKRWDNDGLYNEHWVRVPDSEKPPMADKIEGGCYW